MAAGHSLSTGDGIRPLDVGSASADWASYVRDVAAVLVEQETVEALRALAVDPRTPEDVLLQLCRRPELHDDLGHRDGPRRLLEELADVHGHPEATITVVVELYTSPAESVDVFRGFVDRHADNAWMLESLLLRPASSSEKEQALVGVVQRHPDAGRLLRIVESRRLEAEARQTTDQQRMEQLFATQDRSAWRGLADNPHLPAALLQKLAVVQGGAYAREIRRRAMERHREPRE